MPRTYVIDTRTFQEYVNSVPESQQDHPVIQMLRNILDETYASGYPENVRLVNHASVISSTLWTGEHVRQALLENGMSVLQENIDRINRTAVPKLDGTCRTAGSSLLASAVKAWQKEKYGWPK